MNATSENELLSRLVMTAHLGVSERRHLSLPIGGSQIRLVIEDALNTGEWFRAWWFPDDSMFGCVIEYRGMGGGVYQLRYEGVESEWAESISECCYPTAEDAAAAIAEHARCLIRDNIDGIPIDWER